jgi:phosphodiesterase/alkaline phosphatase D-like protein
MRQASMLDMDMIENGQLEWLIDGILSSQAKWKFLCSSVAWNPTFIGGGSSDVWGGWQAEQMENRYLIQRLAGVTNLIVLSGDRHRAGIDDGSSSVWPECSASPFENTNTTLGGNWSHGTYGRGPNFGLVEIRPTSVTLRVKNAIGADAPGITPLVVEAV